MYDAGCFVGAAVIDHDDFVGAAGLGFQIRENRTNQIGAVPGRNDSRDDTHLVDFAKRTFYQTNPTAFPHGRSQIEQFYLGVETNDLSGGAEAYVVDLAGPEKALDACRHDLLPRNRTAALIMNG